MKTAIGTKVIRFKEMTKEVFDVKKQFLNLNERYSTFPENVYDIPPVELQTPGYHVQYDNPDGSVYDSWSPKDVFEAAYTCTEDGMSFGYALYFMGQGKKVARKGWDGKETWIKLSEDIVNYNKPYMIMKNPDKFVTWLAFQSDILAEDWVLVG